ncbi:MAG: universal stress protein [Paracoccaceae bacterium]
MQKIMLATDFSERSDRALRRATLLARQTGAGLCVVHVVEDDQPRRLVENAREAAAAQLQDLGETLQRVDGLACETRLLLGAAFDGIVRAVAEERPELLILGPHRRQALRDVFSGTTADRAIRAVACPVLMVNAPPVAPYRRLMLATDLSAEDARLVTTCRALGLLDGAEAQLLHVHLSETVQQLASHGLPANEHGMANDAAHEGAASGLDAFARSVGMASAPRMLRRGLHDTGEEILRAASEASADLVVLGTHARSGLERFFLGSVAEAVLRRAERDVLTVPPLQEG